MSLVMSIHHGVTQSTHHNFHMFLYCRYVYKGRFSCICSGHSGSPKIYSNISRAVFFFSKSNHKSVKYDHLGECSPEKDCLCGSHYQSLTVVETPVNVITNSPSQDYTHPDDHTLPTYGMTPVLWYDS